MSVSDPVSAVESGETDDGDYISMDFVPSCLLYSNNNDRSVQCQQMRKKLRSFK